MQQLLPAEQCLWEMSGRVSKRDKAFELQTKLPALISSLSEQVLLEVSRLECRESGICAGCMAQAAGAEWLPLITLSTEEGAVGVAKCRE